MVEWMCLIRLLYFGHFAHSHTLTIFIAVAMSLLFARNEDDVINAKATGRKIPFEPRILALNVLSLEMQRTLANVCECEYVEPNSTKTRSIEIFICIVNLSIQKKKSAEKWTTKHTFWQYQVRGVYV